LSLSYATSKMWSCSSPQLCTFHEGLYLIKQNDINEKDICSSTHYTGRIFTFFADSTALRFTAADGPLAARRTRILPMNQHDWRPITFGMKGRSYLYAQITGDVENVAPLYVDIPRTGGRSSDLPFEAVLQEHSQFPYEYFRSVLLPFWCYCCALCPSNNTRWENHKD
jgi:hypothetical protein